MSLRDDVREIWDHWGSFIIVLPIVLLIKWLHGQF